MPLPEPRLAWRSTVVALGLTMVWGLLILRMLQIQWWQREQFTLRAIRQQRSQEILPAKPGDIFDRRGRLLATTVSVQSLYLDPAQVADPLATALALEAAIGIEAPGLQLKIIEAATKRFLWVKRRLTDEEVARVLAADLPRAEWGFRSEYQREYPQGAIAAHVLGWRDIDGVPHGGIEESLHARLIGQAGRRPIVRDSRGFVISIDEDETQPAIPGENIQLALDTVTQVHVERQLDQLMEAHRPLGACAVVLDPWSGEILAMASRPAFSPTQPELAPPNSWRNLAIQAAYEPGSTFKPLIVAGALDLGMLKTEETFHCGNGVYRMGPRVLHDHHRYGTLSVKEILVKSSNVGMARIGERLTNERLEEITRRFGFGRRTGIELPGELPGTLHPLSQWTIYSTGSIPMGQELTATPLQLLVAHASLANGGRWITPHLALGPQGSSGANVLTTEIISPEPARWVVQEAMSAVVERGTGTKARLAEYPLFGKTGTSQKIEPNGKYSHTRHVSSFVCGAPIDHPRIVVIVTVDEPTDAGSDFGGIVAAPVAAAIVREVLPYMQVPTRMAEKE